MRNQFLFPFFIVYCMYQCAGEKSGDGLIFAHILFRHGERNILSPYPSDDFKDEKYWPGGFGELNSIGRKQQYELGEYLARRYKNLIGENGYHKDKVYVRSTDVDRTLSSAAHTLAGMFPPTKKQIWNEKFGRLWHSIPIHTVPGIEDEILGVKKPCPRYRLAINKAKNSHEIQALIKQHDELLKNLTRFTNSSIASVGDVHKLYDTLKVEHSKGLKIPKYLKDLVKEGSDMEKVANMQFSFYAKTRDTARIRPGFLFKEILEHFVQKANKTLTPDRNLWIYSAHDVTIVTILNALGIFPPKTPTYSSSLFFELHKTGDKFHIEIYYKHERGNDKVPLKPLNIRCGIKCSLDAFYGAYNDIIPTKDFDTECKLD
ncbi:lysosomal acid phosphatase-like [Contarinia nasturtii]|uniref:lysosomal acid phosphatase-like n=1 Tax=Contarinia nasturtii TaxID=265458 RepID=UPI0012D4A47F|nr:lysosomal acid phosphatase-like [Contarinia nasturtii]